MSSSAVPPPNVVLHGEAAVRYTTFTACLACSEPIDGIPRVRSPRLPRFRPVPSKRSASALSCTSEVRAPVCSSILLSQSGERNSTSDGAHGSSQLSTWRAGPAWLVALVRSRQRRPSGRSSAGRCSPTTCAPSPAFPSRSRRSSCAPASWRDGSSAERAFCAPKRRAASCGAVSRRAAARRWRRTPTPRRERRERPSAATTDGRARASVNTSTGSPASIQSAGEAPPSGCARGASGFVATHPMKIW